MVENQGFILESEICEQLLQPILSPIVSGIVLFGCFRWEPMNQNVDRVTHVWGVASTMGFMSGFFPLYVIRAMGLAIPAIPATVIGMGVSIMMAAYTFGREYDYITDNSAFKKVDLAIDSFAQFATTGFVGSFSSFVVPTLLALFFSVNGTPDPVVVIPLCFLIGTISGGYHLLRKTYLAEKECARLHSADGVNRAWGQTATVGAIDYFSNVFLKEICQVEVQENFVVLAMVTIGLLLGLRAGARHFYYPSPEAREGCAKLNRMIEDSDSDQNDRLLTEKDPLLNVQDDENSSTLCSRLLSFCK